MSCPNTKKITRAQVTYGDDSATTGARLRWYLISGVSRPWTIAVKRKFWSCLHIAVQFLLLNTVRMSNECLTSNMAISMSFYLLRVPVLGVSCSCLKEQLQKNGKLCVLCKLNHSGRLVGALMATHSGSPKATQMVIC